MKGRPFRIAAAGLCTAFLCTVVAAVLHFDAESKGLTQHTPIRDLEAPDVQLAQAESEAPASVIIPAPSDLPDEIPSEEIAAFEPEVDASLAAVVETNPDDHNSPSRFDSPIRATVTHLRHHKEFIELPPPPEFLTDDELAQIPEIVAEDSAPMVLAELASLRRDFARLVEEEQSRRVPDIDPEASRTSQQLERSLAALKESIDGLRSEQRAQREMLRDAERRRMAAEIEASVAAIAAPIEPVEEPAPVPPPIESSPSETVQVSPAGPRLPISIRPSQLPGCYDIEMNGARLDEVLAAIGQAGGWNLVVSPRAEGTVTIAWRNVTPQQALEALLKAHRLVSERQASFVMISTAEEVESRAAAARSVQVQLYRLHYLSSSDLAPLIKPLLTPGVGQVGVTLDRNTEAAIAAIADADGTLPPDALLVVDYPEVIEMVGRAIGELDVPAQHVELEATLLDVELQGALREDVWRILNPNSRETEFDSRSVTGTQNGSCQTSCQVCSESGEHILSCLRAATEVRVLSQARLQVLDKQTAELSIGGIDVQQPPGARNVVSGSPQDETRLRVKPFVSADGMIRLDVAPEGRPGPSRPAYASLRTTVAVSDGGTLIIADLNNSENSGTLSATAGPAFRGRGKPAAAIRHEFILLITPRTVHTGGEGDRNLAPLTAAGEERLIQ